MCFVLNAQDPAVGAALVAQMTENLRVTVGADPANTPHGRRLMAGHMPQVGEAQEDSRQPEQTASGF